jgi:hypothetical protein
VHKCGDEADASDAHQSPLLNLCHNPVDVSAREACDAHTCGCHRLQLQSCIPRLAFCCPGFLAPRIRGPCRRAALSGGRSGFVPVGIVVRPHDRGAADIHLPGQPAEALAGLPAAVDLRCNLLILRDERLAGLPWFTAAAIDAARRPLSSPMQVQCVADDLGSDAERLGDQVDA